LNKVQQNTEKGKNQSWQLSLVLQFLLLQWAKFIRVYFSNIVVTNKQKTLIFYTMSKVNNNFKILMKKKNSKNILHLESIYCGYVLLFLRCEKRRIALKEISIIQYWNQK
jgi:hypothetical protein